MVQYHLGARIMESAFRRVTAAEAALVTVFLINRYVAEKGKEVSRLRLSRSSVRRLALRANLRESFVEEWRDALATDWGWIAFPLGEQFGLIRDDSVSGWVRLGTTRIAAQRKKLKTCDV